MTSLGLHVILGDGSGDGNTRLPRIGYDNAGVGAAVTADSTATGYTAASLFDWKPYTYWKPATDGSHHVTVIPASTATVDYFAVAQHNLGTNGGTIQLQYSLDSGASWLDATPSLAPVSDEAIWRSFVAITASHWRVLVVSTPASVVAIVAFGSVYQPYFGNLPGFSPPKLARSTEEHPTESDAGLFLGSSVLSRHLETEITFNNMDVDDCYNYWLPFMKHAERGVPFFLAWLIEDHPTDIALMKRDGAMPKPSFMRHGVMTCGIRMRGLSPS